MGEYMERCLYRSLRIDSSYLFSSPLMTRMAIIITRRAMAIKSIIVGLIIYCS